MWRVHFHFHSSRGWVMLSCVALSWLLFGPCSLHPFHISHSHSVVIFPMLLLSSYLRLYNLIFKYISFYNIHITFQKIPHLSHFSITRFVKAMTSSSLIWINRISFGLRWPVNTPNTVVFAATNPKQTQGSGRVGKNKNNKT